MKHSGILAGHQQIITPSLKGQQLQFVGNINRLIGDINMKNIDIIQQYKNENKQQYNNNINQYTDPVLIIKFK